MLKARYIISFLMILGLSFTLFYGCKKKENDVIPKGSVTDIDGNIYSTVQIGNQTWMADNLKVKHFQNGDSIYYKKYDYEWLNTNIASFSGPYSQTDPSIKYGFFYNDSALVDSRNIAPAGWRVPNDEDWNILINYIGGLEAAVDLKSKYFWTNYYDYNDTTISNPYINGSGNDKYGFDGQPAGYRDSLGVIGNLNKYANWGSTGGQGLLISYKSKELPIRFQHSGVSVRCIKN